MTTFSLAGCSQSQSNSDQAGNKTAATETADTDEDEMDNQTTIDDELKKEVEAGHSFKEPFVAVDPYGNAPLSAVVIFTTEDETGVKVKVSGHTAANDIENKFDKAKEHIIPIYGLYAGEENKVTLTLDDGTTKELKITTEDLDDSYKKAEVTKAESKNMEEGLTFVSMGNLTSDKTAIAAYDDNGDIRWALKSNAPAWETFRLQNGKILVSSSQKKSDPYYTTGIREIDLMGKTYAEYMVPGGYHHSTTELPNGDFLVAAQKDNADTVEDVAYEISKTTGEVVKTFDLKDIIPTDDGSSLIEDSDDWFHLNAVWYDKSTNSVMFSGRTVNSVVSVDYETGKLRWILGDPEGWSKVDKKYFFTPVGSDFQWQYAQHASMITPEGYVFLFDDGPYRAKKTNESEKLSADENYSRGVLYKIDETNMTIKQVWQYGKELGSDWYSLYLGDVDYLSQNHYLIDSGGQLYNTKEKTREVEIKDLMNSEIQKTCSIVEINNNKVVFEMKLNTNSFAAERMAVYTEKGDFDLYTTGKILGKSN